MQLLQKYTQSVLIRNGPIRSTSEILAFFKKSPVELSKLRNGEITFQIFKKCTSESFQFKKWFKFLFTVVFHSRAGEKPPRRNTRVDYLALSKGE